MNIKANKGITMLTLVITVIVLIILAYTTITISMNLTGVARYQNVQTYMLLMKSKCEMLLNEVVIGELEENQLFGEKQDSGDYSGWYKLRQAEINDMGVKEAIAKDGYYVKYNKSSGEVDVAYEPGVEDNGEVFYKLSDILMHSGN